MGDKEQTQENQEAQLPKPAETKKKVSAQAAAKPSAPIRRWQYVGIIFFCFVASFFGSWLFLATGIVSQNAVDNITDNRNNIVLQEGELVADIANKVAPSVVSIVTEAPSDSLLRQFDGTVQSSGTGIVISQDGYVLTNKHVIQGDGEVQVVTSEGEVYDDVTVVGTDPFNDLGFLKINGVDNLAAAELGDSYDTKVGQKVVAIGNALGEYQNTVTSGIISGIGRPVQATDGSGQLEQLDSLFQTDAAINPGNSGGPLLDLDGKVIGINTAIAEEAEGIGFAIPVDAAKGLVKTVTETGNVSRAYLGVQYQSITPALAKELDLPVKAGAYLAGGDDRNPVVSNTPADKAGLQARDIITKVNDKPVDSRAGLSLLLAEYVPGDEVTLTVLRSEQEQEVKVTLGTYR